MRRAVDTPNFMPVEAVVACNTFATRYRTSPGTLTHSIRQMHDLYARLRANAFCMHAQEAHGSFSPMSSSATLRKMSSNDDVQHFFPASPMQPSREEQHSTRWRGAQSWPSFDSQADAFNISASAQFAERRTSHAGHFSDQPWESDRLTDWQQSSERAQEQAPPQAEHDVNGQSDRWQGFTISHRSAGPSYTRSAPGPSQQAQPRQQQERASCSAASSSPRYHDGFAPGRDAVSAAEPVAAHLRSSGNGAACSQAVSDGGSPGALLDEVTQQRGRIWEVADRVSALKQKRHEETERMLWDARFQVRTHS